MQSDRWVQFRLFYQHVSCLTFGEHDECIKKGIVESQSSRTLRYYKFSSSYDDDSKE